MFKIVTISHYWNNLYFSWWNKLGSLDLWYFCKFSHWITCVTEYWRDKLGILSSSFNDKLVELLVNLNCWLFLKLVSKITGDKLLPSFNSLYFEPLGQYFPINSELSTKSSIVG